MNQLKIKKVNFGNMLEINKIYNQDCIEGMKLIDDKSIDMICCDLPYGSTNCKWDVIIPFDQLWEQYKRIIKDNGAIVLFGQEPFSSYLRISNIDWYRYDLVWEKESATNFMQLKRRFGKTTEMISIFYKSQPTYNPQFYEHKGKPVYAKCSSKSKRFKSITTSVNENLELYEYVDNGLRYPKDVLRFNRVCNKHEILHPTQKPVELIEYLVKTFTNEGDLVLDNCMGSGTTAIACINTSRNFIGFETDEKYFNVAVNRIIENTQEKLF